MLKFSVRFLFGCKGEYKTDRNANCSIKVDVIPVILNFLLTSLHIKAMMPCINFSTSIFVLNIRNEQLNKQIG